MEQHHGRSDLERAGDGWRSQVPVRGFRKDRRVASDGWAEKLPTRGDREGKAGGDPESGHVRGAAGACEAGPTTTEGECAERTGQVRKVRQGPPGPSEERRDTAL